MATDRLSVAEVSNPLGEYLKDRRSKLDPKAFGFPSVRRRTPGLRREEVAQRANVSATWYTWLEQGRGGAPSVDALERIARALTLNDTEREHLFLLAQGRPPKVRDTASSEIVTPRLQRLLDSLTRSPAFVKNATWDILAWNRAATVVMRDCLMQPEQRNLLRLVFSEGARTRLNWENVARSLVASFRGDIARAGAPPRGEALVRDLCRDSAAFEAMWRDHDVLQHGEGTKYIQHAKAGRIGLDYSTLSVDGQPNLGLVIYTPATAEDEAKIAELLA